MKEAMKEIFGVIVVVFIYYALSLAVCIGFQFVSFQHEMAGNWEKMIFIWAPIGTALLFACSFVGKLLQKGQKKKGK